MPRSGPELQKAYSACRHDKRNVAFEQTQASKGPNSYTTNIEVTLEPKGHGHQRLAFFGISKFSSWFEPGI